MAANEYHLVSRWRVRGRLEAVYEILYNAPGYVRWWSKVFLEVRRADGGGEGAASVRTTGFLPYTLCFQARLVGEIRPLGFALKITGDFVGRGAWSLRQDGEWVDVRFEWRVRAEKPLVRYLSFLLRPLFAANHRWAMRRGEAGLRAELARLQVTPAA